jgi:hypothetical protein
VTRRTSAEFISWAAADISLGEACASDRISKFNPTNIYLSTTANSQLAPALSAVPLPVPDFAGDFLTQVTADLAENYERPNNQNIFQRTFSIGSTFIGSSWLCELLLQAVSKYDMKLRDVSSMFCLDVI